MVKKYKVIYWEHGDKFVEMIKAFSVNDAKLRFYSMYPMADIVKIEEVK